MSRSSHLDNQTDRPGRSPFMASDELERALRDSLSRQAAGPIRLAVDPAGSAIRRARGIQRRRAVAGLALAAVATAGVTAGAAQLGEAPGRHPGQIVVIGDPPVSPAPGDPDAAPLVVLPSGAAGGPLVDIVVGKSLRTRTGEHIDLTAVGEVERAQQTTGGWLVTGAPAADGRTLWFVDRENPPRVVLAGVESVALAADGRQVAWRDGPELFAAGVIGGKAIGTARTPLPDRAAPVGFVGDLVVVRLGAAAGESGGYALWRPGPAAFVPHWSTGTLAVYGTLPDGRVVGQVSTGTPRRPCLALLDAGRGLAPARSACNLSLDPGGAGLVSPDGRWLVVNGRSGPSGTVTGALVVDLSRAFDGALAPPPSPAGQPLVSTAGWADPTTLLHVGRDGMLIRVPAPAVAAGGTVDAVRMSPVDGVLMVVGGTA